MVVKRGCRLENLILVLNLLYNQCFFHLLKILCILLLKVFVLVRSIYKLDKSTPGWNLFPLLQFSIREFLALFKGFIIDLNDFHFNWNGHWNTTVNLTDKWVESLIKNYKAMKIYKITGKANNILIFLIKKYSLIQVFFYLSFRTFILLI